jgi:hypothetical protein
VRLVIFGSRSLSPRATTIDRVVFERWGVLPSLVISGTARGADCAGERWAYWRNIPVEQFPADWDGLGRGAGFARNAKMARRAQAGLGFWDGASRGTAQMVSCLQGLGRPYHIEVLT